MYLTWIGAVTGSCASHHFIQPYAIVNPSRWWRVALARRRRAAVLPCCATSMINCLGVRGTHIFWHKGRYIDSLLRWYSTHLGMYWYSTVQTQVGSLGRVVHAGHTANPNFSNYTHTYVCTVHRLPSYNRYYIVAHPDARMHFASCHAAFLQPLAPTIYI